MSKRNRRNLQLVLLVVVVLWVLGRLPSYSLIVVRGPNGRTVIEHSGPGPHVIEHNSTDGSLSVQSGVIDPE